jgi:hypothetical protein
LAGNAIEQTSIANKVNIMVWLSLSYQRDGQKSEGCNMFKKTLELAKTIDYTWAINNANNGLKSCP